MTPKQHIIPFLEETLSHITKWYTDPNDESALPDWVNESQTISKVEKIFRKLHGSPQRHVYTQLYKYYFFVFDGNRVYDSFSKKYLDEYATLHPVTLIERAIDENMRNGTSIVTRILSDLQMELDLSTLREDQSISHPMNGMKVYPKHPDVKTLVAKCLDATPRLKAKKRFPTLYKFYFISNGTSRGVDYWYDSFLDKVTYKNPYKNKIYYKTPPDSFIIACCNTKKR